METNDLIRRQDAIEKFELYEEEEMIHPGFIKLEQAITIPKKLPTVEQNREKVTVETLNDIISSLRQLNMSPEAANTILLGQIALNLAVIADSLERKGRE